MEIFMTFPRNVIVNYSCNKENLDASNIVSFISQS